MYGRPLRWCEYNRRTPTPSALVAGTRDGISFVRSLAAWHLGRLGPGHPGIESLVPELRELLNDNDPSVRAEALVALENLAGKGAPPAELKSLAPTADPAMSPTVA